MPNAEIFSKIKNITRNRFQQHFGFNEIKIMSTIINSNYQKLKKILETPPDSRSELDIIELVDLTYSVDFLSKLRTKYSISVHERCCRYLTLKTYLKNEYIYEVGDTSNSYYILIKGTVSLMKNNQKQNLSIQDSESSEFSDYEDHEINKLQRSRNRVVIVNSDDISNYHKEKYADVQEKTFESFKNYPLDTENCGLIEFVANFDIIGESDHEFKTIEPVKDFGQGALINNKPRLLNAIARSNVEVAVLLKSDFNTIMKDITEKKNTELLDFLAKVSIFSKWSRANLYKIIFLFETKTFTKGQYVYKQNDPVNSVYIIKKGDFKVVKTVLEDYGDKKFLFNNETLKFRSETKKKLKRLDLVLVSETEILGAEDIFASNQFRQYSCMCNSALAEVLSISKVDFTTKLLKFNSYEKYSKNSQISNKWLENRSSLLNGFETTPRALPSKLNKIPVLYNKNSSQIAKKLKNVSLTSSFDTKDNITITDRTGNLLKKFYKSVCYKKKRIQSVETENLTKPKQIYRRKVPPPNFWITFREKTTQLKTASSDPEKIEEKWTGLIKL
jgi:CRP-like cAMP-binding protein